jgi:hypothetical protein
MSILDTFTTKLGNFVGLNTNRLPRADEGFDVARFRSQIVGDSGLLRTNLFLVSISFPTEFASTQSQLMKLTPRTLMMFTEATSLPGLSLMSDDSIRRYGTGVTEKMPYGAVFTDLSISFLADGNGEILKMFHNWMKYIVNYDSSINGVTSKFNGAEPYEVGYKDQYAATMEITVYSEAADKIITYKINEVFPLFLGDISMGWADNDSIMRVPVTFSYRDWITNSMDRAALKPGVSNNLTTLQKILKVGTVVQTVSAMKSPNSVGDAIGVLNNANILRSAF